MAMGYGTMWLWDDAPSTPMRHVFCMLEQRGMPTLCGVSQAAEVDTLEKERDDATLRCEEQAAENHALEQDIKRCRVQGSGPQGAR